MKIYRQKLFFIGPDGSTYTLGDIKNAMIDEYDHRPNQYESAGDKAKRMLKAKQNVEKRLNISNSANEAWINARKDTNKTYKKLAEKTLEDWKKYGTITPRDKEAAGFRKNGYNHFGGKKKYEYGPSILTDSVNKYVNSKDFEKEADNIVGDISKEKLKKLTKNISNKRGFKKNATNFFKRLLK